ncbi:MAG: DNA cytosine methyltransferase [Pirellulales bacterium]|nr:DNA cytosine methyltransferase [Pirellulales bacterium]
MGGLSLGLERAGFDTIGGIDNWHDAAKTYEHNHKRRVLLTAR